MAAAKLSTVQLSCLNVCWNNVFRKIFGFHKWESVSAFIDGLGCLNFKSMWYLSVIKLIKKMLRVKNCVINNTVQLFCHSPEWRTLLDKLNVDYRSPMYIIERTIRDLFHRVSADH